MKRIITKNDKRLKMTAIIFTLGFLISLLPILYASFFCHPIGDDYGFSSGVHNAIVNGSGFFGALNAAINQAASSYNNWQGTYSAVFLFALQPGAFSDNLYFLTTFIMIISMSLGTFFFIDTFVTKVFSEKRAYSFIISSVILFCSFQFVPDKAEAFFWYNGAVYYTFFYSLSLVLYALLIKMAKSDRHRIAYTIVCCALAAVIGGGNYTTALFTSIILVFSVIGAFVKKKNIKIHYLIITIVLLTGFLISAVAPGNSVRANTTQSMPAVKAIISSVWYFVIFIIRSTNLSQIAVVCLLIPIALKITKNINFNFKYPFVVIALAVLISASQMTPALYAISSLGSGRQLDIYYYWYYVLLAFVTVYVCGWINKKELLDVSHLKCYISDNYYKMLVLFLALCMASVFNISVKETTSVSISVSAINKTINQYDEEYKSIEQQALHGNTNLENIETVPEFYKGLGLSNDKTFWINRQFANYFDLDYVIAQNQN